MGRPTIPGDTTLRDFLDPEGVKDRTIHAGCADVDTRNGIIKVKFDGHGSNGRFTNIPLLWASFPERGRGAWGRYMPCKNDRLKITFDYDDSIRAVGYDVLAGKQGIADGRVGWPQINDAVEAGVLPYFPELSEGEFDFMSIGGAYVHGSDRGVLTLTGGLFAQLQLDPDGATVLGTARQYKLGAGVSTVTLGEVRRLDPTSAQDVSIGPWNPSGLEQEFQVKVSKSVGGVESKQARFAIGGIASDVAIEIGANGSPRRMVLETFDTAGVAPLMTMEADSTGAFDLTSVVQIKYTAPIIDVAGGQVKLGTAPTGGVLNGASFGSGASTAETATKAKLKSLKMGWVGGNPTYADLTALSAVIEQYVSAITSAVQSATSKTVMVT